MNERKYTAKLEAKMFDDRDYGYDDAHECEDPNCSHVAPSILRVQAFCFHLAVPCLADNQILCVDKMVCWHSVPASWFKVMSEAYERDVLRMCRGYAWWTNGTTDVATPFCFKDYCTMFMGITLQQQPFPLASMSNSLQQFFFSIRQTIERLEFIRKHLTLANEALNTLCDGLESGPFRPKIEFIDAGDVYDAHEKICGSVDDLNLMCTNAAGDWAYIRSAQWHAYGGTLMALQRGALGTCGKTLPPYVMHALLEILDPVAAHLFTEEQLIECINRYTRSAVSVHDQQHGRRKRSPSPEPERARRAPISQASRASQ